MKIPDSLWQIEFDVYGREKETISKRNPAPTIFPIYSTKRMTVCLEQT